MVPTESSFYSVVKNIFNSKLCGDYAFIEPLNLDIPKKLANNKIQNILILTNVERMFYITVSIITPCFQ